MSNLLLRNCRRLIRVHYGIFDENGIQLTKRNLAISSYHCNNTNFNLTRTNVLICSSSNSSHDQNQQSYVGSFRIDTQYIQFRNAGHSKWANIKHAKSLKDGEKAKEFNKFMNSLRVAARGNPIKKLMSPICQSSRAESLFPVKTLVLVRWLYCVFAFFTLTEGKSPDPKVNKKLADAIERAKDAKVPTATIQRTLEHLSKGFSKTGDLKSLMFPFKGPGGCVILAHIETGHVTKTRQEIVPMMKKHSFLMAEDSVMHQFLLKGIILCASRNGKPLGESDLEECTDHAIESEASEVEWTDSPEYGNVMEFSSEPENFYKVCHNLEKLNYEIVYSELDYLPLKTVEPTDEQLDNISKAYAKLSDYPDVTRLHDNIG